MAASESSFAHYSRLRDYVASSDMPDLANITELLVRGSFLDDDLPSRNPRIEHSRVRRVVRKARTRLASLWAPRSRLGRSRILVVAQHDRPDYVPLIAPALHVLAQGHGLRATILCAGSTVDAWRQATVGSNADVQDLSDLHAAWMNLPAGQLPIGTRARVAKVFSPLGLSDGAIGRAADVYAAYARDRAVLGRAIDTVRPKVMLGIHFVNVPGYLAAAKRVGSTIPVTLVQHGIISHEFGFHDFAGADVLAVWSGHWARELARYPVVRGYEVPRAVVTGNPRVEYERVRGLASTAGRGEGCAGELPVVLYARSGDPAPHIDALVLQALGRDARWRLVVKPHPAHSMATVLAGLDSSLVEGVTVLKPSSDSFDAIRIASVVVGAGSTMLLDAMAVGRPTVSLTCEATGLRGAGDIDRLDAQRVLADRVSELLGNPRLRAEAIEASKQEVGNFVGDSVKAADHVARLVHFVHQHC